MKHVSKYKSIFSSLMVFTFITYGQEITLIDFGVDVQNTTIGNWNNFIDQTVPASALNLINNTGASTGEILTLTDSFDLYNRNNQGTQTPGVFFGGFPLPTTAARDSFFGESVTFNNGGPSTETTGGFTFSGLEVGKYYSFRIFASRIGVTDNRETLYIITGNAGAQTATLDAANNTSNVAAILYVQPSSSGNITIQATTGPNNTNIYGFYYLGAIEMTKTTCKLTVTWNGSSWTPQNPDLTTKAIINENYNTSTTGIGSFSACSLTVSNNATLNVANNTYVEVQNDISVDAGSAFLVQPYGTVKQIDDLGTVTNNGTMTVVKRTSPLNAWYEYTYWSSPVSGANIGSALSDSDVSRRYFFNAQKFLDATAESGNDNSTGVGHDDIDDDGNDWQWVNSSIVMQPGVGYAATHSKAFFIGAPTSSPPYQFDYTFDGTFNNGVITVPLYRNDSETGDNNWNFIGNPFPSAISADSFLAANAIIDANVMTSKTIDGALFLWSQNTTPSSSFNGSQALNFSSDDYAIINGVGTSSGGDGVFPSRFIPSGQGFFVSMSNSAPATLVSGNVFTTNAIFNNSMRVNGASNNSQFFKNSNTKDKSAAVINNKLWINLTSNNGVFNQTLIGYVNGATNNNDGMYYDATKNLSIGTAAVLYTTIDGCVKKFAIQGKAIDSINADEIINIGFSTIIDVPTQYTLSIAKQEGDFLKSHTVYLKDNLINTLHDLSTSDYTFTSKVGEFNTRFQIVFNANALEIKAFKLNANTVRVLQVDDMHVSFKASNNQTIKTVTIFDLLGRQLYQLKGRKNEEIYNFSNLNHTIFIAKVALSNGSLITKKVIKK
jgi:hypothetical protein